MCLGWLSRLPLQLDTNILLFRFLPESLVLLHTLDEVIPALGVAHVLDAYVDPLRNDTSTHSFVDDHSKSVCRYVEHTTSLAVIHLVRHSLLHCAVPFDVNDVANFVRLHVRGQGDSAMFAELAREQVPRPTSVTLGIGHGDVLQLICNQN